MMRLVFIAVWLAVLTGLARPQADIAWMQEREPARLSGQVRADYAVAMAAFAQMQEGEGAPLLGTRTRWLWVAEDGSTVQRVAENTFRWRKGDCLSAFCVAVDCFVGVWPDLSCADGEERRISAPDLATVILQDVTFRRNIP